jgi:hypothetical protein
MRKLHNPMKLPTMLLCVAVGTGMVVVGITTSACPLAFMGGLGALCGAAVPTEMARGHNPSWMRSRNDPPQ